MKRLLILTALALSAPAAMAGTATFGLFPHYGKCGSCSACPGPWNAFSPTGCCAVENANGCTLYPCGYHGNPYIAGGFPIGGGGHHCGPFGCGLFGHGGHHGYGWNAGMPYPCGAVGAWHGMPGMGGCADPFGGCGTAYKPTLKDKLAGLFHHHGATSAPPEHLWDYFGDKFGGKFHGGFGGFAGETVIGGGCPGCDAPVTAPLQAPAAAPATPAPPSAPVTTPVLYQPAMMQPVSYQTPAAYYPMPMTYGYGYGYYPAYGYGYGYGYPMGW